MDSVGLTRGSVVLREHDHRWAGAFASVAQDLAQALGHRALAIEHVGSTAVPGLRAKPIIDIAVTLADGVTATDCTRSLERAGFAFRGDQGGEGGLLYVLSDRPGHRLAHVHVVGHDDSQWVRYLQFRDHLRDDPGLRAAYGRLKVSLASEFPSDRAAYTMAKDEFINDAITSGESTGDSPP